MNRFLIKIDDAFCPQYIDISSVVYAEEKTKEYGEPSLSLTLSTGMVVIIKKESAIKEIREILESRTSHITDKQIGDRILNTSEI